MYFYGKDIALKKGEDISKLLKDKPELEFIIGGLSNNKKENLPSPLKKGELNQDEFIRLIKHHRLDSIFYKAVKEQNIELPQELDNKLAKIDKSNRMRMMKLTAELIRIHRLFTENGIEYISLKGPALSQQIYGDYTVRNSRDLDILVREGDFVKAGKLLKLINYKNNKNFNAINRFNYKEYVFVDEQNNIVIELHHRLFNNKYLLPITSKDFSKVEKVKINNVEIPVLNNNLNFIYISIHAAAHNWKRLNWALDVILFRKYSKINNLITLEQFPLVNKTFGYNMEDYLLLSDEKELRLFGKFVHLLKLKRSKKYLFQEILQRLFIPYRFFDGH